MNQSQCYDLRFPKATTHLIVGVSGAGNTMRTLNILRMKNELIVDGDSIQNVIFCYSAWQPIYEEAKSYVTKWINEMPTNEEFISMVKPYQTLGGSIVVLDDFLGAINKDMMEMVCGRFDVSSFFFCFSFSGSSLHISNKYVTTNPYLFQIITRWNCFIFFIV